MRASGSIPFRDKSRPEHPEHLRRIRQTNNSFFLVFGLIGQTKNIFFLVLGIERPLPNSQIYLFFFC
jgi:hypothetical protein